MTGFALWGARRSDVQVGSREDRRLQLRLNRDAARWRELELRRTTTTSSRRSSSGEGGLVIRSGDHAPWDATLRQAQLRQLVRGGTTSAEAMRDYFANLERAFAKAARALAATLGPALAELARAVEEGRIK